MLQAITLLTGGLMVGDGLLGLTCPSDWSRLWRHAGRLFPGPTEHYFDRVMDLTDEYRGRSPSGLRAMQALEVVAGAAILLSALRSRRRVR